MRSLVACLAVACGVVAAIDAPVIAILTVPSTADEPCATLVATQGADPTASCVAIFYSVWLQAAGARTVFIPYDAAPDTLDAIFTSVNGLLFTGGSQPLWLNTTYIKTASYLFDKVPAGVGVWPAGLAEEGRSSGPSTTHLGAHPKRSRSAQVLAANDAGDFFPLHGTCMGFQTISILAARNESVLETYAYDSEGIAWPLDFTADAPATRLWGGLSPADLGTFRTVDSTVNLHHDGVPPAAYAENPRLQELLVLTSTNVDRAGKPFVSSFVGRSHPITAVQFHPEKVGAQFSPGLGIPHTADVIAANRAVADFFVADARRSTHVFDPTLGPRFAAAAFTPKFVGDVMNNYGAYLLPFGL